MGPKGEIWLPGQFLDCLARGFLGVHKKIFSLNFLNHFKCCFNYDLIFVLLFVEPESNNNFLYQGLCLGYCIEYNLIYKDW